MSNTALTLGSLVSSMHEEGEKEKEKEDWVRMSLTEFGLDSLPAPDISRKVLPDANGKYFGVLTLLKGDILVPYPKREGVYVSIQGEVLFTITKGGCAKRPAFLYDVNNYNVPYIHVQKKRGVKTVSVKVNIIDLIFTSFYPDFPLSNGGLIPISPEFYGSLDLTKWKYVPRNAIVGRMCRSKAPKANAPKAPRRPVSSRVGVRLGASKLAVKDVIELREEAARRLNDGEDRVSVLLWLEGRASELKVAYTTILSAVSGGTWGSLDEIAKPVWLKATARPNSMATLKMLGVV